MSNLLPDSPCPANGGKFAASWCLDINFCASLDTSDTYKQETQTRSMCLEDFSISLDT